MSEGKTLREWCRQEGKPHYSTVYDWKAKDAKFAQRFARARELGAEAIAEDCFTIADDARNDWMERFDKEGQGIGWVLNGDHVQRDKLRIETRLKLLAKWFPKKYGELVKMEHTGADGGPIAVRPLSAFYGEGPGEEDEKPEGEEG
jgi:hypothetical protein